MYRYLKKGKETQGCLEEWHSGPKRTHAEAWCSEKSTQVRVVGHREGQRREGGQM